VDNAIAAINTLIEPVLMVLMAFMIGFIVLAVLLPIYGLTDTSTI
jgi:type II secretory pathway component PulF